MMFILPTDKCMLSVNTTPQIAVIPNNIAEGDGAYTLIKKKDKTAADLYNDKVA